MATFHLLGELARSSQRETDAFTPTLGNAFTKALEAAKRVREEQQAAALGEILTELLKQSEDFKNRHIQRIRQARAAERLSKRHLDELDRAWRYANETQNFVPLTALMGMGHLTRCTLTQEEYDRYSKIPSDWVPSDESE